jgi:hypothetical protein
MKTLLIYASPSMYSDELTLQKYYTAHSEGDSIVIDDYISQYKSHWKAKKVAKVVIVVVGIGTSDTHIHSSETLLHPLKEKIIINKPSSKTVARRPTTMPVLGEIQNPPLPIWGDQSSTFFQGDFESAVTDYTEAA